MENDWVAELDQMKRGLRDFAQTIFTYYRECLDAGFTAEQAFALTVSFQANVQSGQGQN